MHVAWLLEIGTGGQPAFQSMGLLKQRNLVNGRVLFWCRYSKEWEKTVKRIGRWIDFENDYKTLDPTFMESVWWVFSELFKKGLVYRGFKVRPMRKVLVTR